MAQASQGSIKGISKGSQDQVNGGEKDPTKRQSSSKLDLISRHKGSSSELPSVSKRKKVNKKALAIELANLVTHVQVRSGI
jgi:hypothetical protein